MQDLLDHVGVVVDWQPSSPLVRVDTLLRVLQLLRRYHTFVFCIYHKPIVPQKGLLPADASSY